MAASTIEVYFTEEFVSAPAVQQWFASRQSEVVPISWFLEPKSNSFINNIEDNLATPLLETHQAPPEKFARLRKREHQNKQRKKARQTNLLPKQSSVKKPRCAPPTTSFLVVNKTNNVKCRQETVTRDDEAAVDTLVESLSEMPIADANYASQSDSDGDETTCDAKGEEEGERELGNNQHKDENNDCNEDSKGTDNNDLDQTKLFTIEQWWTKHASAYMFEYSVGEAPSSPTTTTTTKVLTFRERTVSHFRMMYYMKKMSGGTDVGNAGVCRRLSKIAKPLPPLFNTKRCNSVLSYEQYVREIFQKICFVVSFTDSNESGDLLIYWPDLVRANLDSISLLCTLARTLFSFMAIKCCDDYLQTFLQHVLQLALKF